MTQDTDSKSKIFELRKLAESALAEKAGDAMDISTPSTKDLQKLVNELRVYQMELDMHDEDLRQAQEKVRSSEELFRKFFELSVNYCYMVSSEGVIFDANASALKMLGYKRDELVGQSVAMIYAPESQARARAAFEKWKRTGRVENEELVVLTKSGQRRTVVLNVSAHKSDRGLISVSVQTDITGRKKAEERLRKEGVRANLLLGLYKKAPELTDKELYDYALDQAVQLTDSTIGFFHLVADDQKTIILTTWNSEALQNCSASYATHYPLEQAGNWVDCVRLKHPIIYNDFPASPNRKGLPEGHAPVLRFMSIPVFDGDKVRIIFGVGNKAEEYGDYDVRQIELVASELQKILKQRRSEMELRESEERFRVMADSSPVMLWMSGTDGLCTFFSRGWLEFRGRAMEQELGNGWAEGVHPEDLGRCLDTYLSSFEMRKDFTMEYRLKRHDGDFRWILDNGVPRFGATREFMGYIGSCIDITERKRAEEALHRLNRELRAVSNCNQTMLRAANEQTLLNDICRIVCDDAGYRLAWVGYAENDDAKTVRPVAWAGVEDGYIANTNITWADTERGRGPAGTVIRSGEIVYVQDFATDPRMAPWRESALQQGYRSGIALPLKDEDSCVFGVLLIYATESNSITPEEIRLLEELAADLAFGIVALRTRAERDRAHDLLREREEEFRTLAENLPDHVTRFDTAGRVQYINPCVIRDYGVTPNQVIGKTLLELNTPGSAAGDRKFSDAIMQAIEEGIPNILEGKWMTRRGERFFEVRHIPEKDESGTVVSVLGIVRDITERKQAEDRLRLLDFALDHVSEAAILTDENARFRFANEESCRKLGYTRSELLVLGVSDIDPDFPVDRWLRHWHDLKTKGSLIFEGRHKTKDGRFFPVEINANYFEYGGQGYNLALVRDITERKQAEQERLANLRFFESMDRVNRTIQGASDVDSMMSEVLEVVLSIFDCDRAWLFYPCDPDAPLFRVPMEVSKPEYPGAKILNVDIPMPPDMAQDLREALESVGPVTYTAGTEKPINKVSADQFGVKSMMMVALYPKLDKPWAFGLHQCSYPRVWTSEEERLFKEIGRRLGDALTGLLTHRNLRQSEAKLAEAQRIAHVGHWDRDIDADLHTLSDEACRIFGLPSQERIFKVPQWHERWLALIHPDDRPKTAQAFAEALQVGSRYDMEYRVVWPNGEVRTVHSYGEVTRDEAGRPRRLVGTMQDITERKRVEEQLNRLFTAVEHAGEAIVVTDAVGTILYVNPAFESSTGYERHEAIGNNPRILQSGKHDNAFYQNMWDTLLSGQVWRGRFTNRRKDGTLYEETATISPIRDEGGRVVNYVAVKRDVTGESLLQKQLIEAQKMEAIGTLAGGIAHDFNNLLQVINGYAEIAMFRIKEGDVGYSALLEIRRAARSAAELTQGLLTFSRRMESKLKPVDLNRELQEVAKMLARTLPKMIEIEMDLFEPLDTVNSDPAQLQQVVMNLAVNARDAMPNGGVLSIETKNVYLDEEYCKSYLEVSPGNSGLLSISDSGTGMDEETRKHIFDPFFTTKETGKGTGLGLSIVFGIVKSHGGNILCHSEPGHGTTFKVYLPALGTTRDVAETMQFPACTGGNETILLVDDEESVRKLADELLKGFGYTVLTACDGRECVEVFSREKDRIDLVILDLIMPEMGGSECLTEILKTAPQTKVIIASGYVADGQIDQALEKGAKSFVTKPYDARQLLERVRQVLNQE